MGNVVDPPPTKDDLFPRTVSMAWGEGCDAEVGPSVFFHEQLRPHYYGIVYDRIRPTQAAE